MYNYLKYVIIRYSLIKKVVFTNINIIFLQKINNFYEKLKL